MHFAVPLRACSLLVAICLAVSARLEARVWTDNSGRAVEAEFVRITGTNAVLQLPTGRVVQTPLANLSHADQEFIREALAAAGVRVWTDQLGRQVHGEFVRVRDSSVYLKTNEKTTPVPFRTLSTADRLLVRKLAGERGAADELPEPTPDETLPETRTWRDIDGVEALGQLDRVLPDGRILLAVDGETKVVTIKKLTPADHDYLREKLTGTRLANLIPPKPKPKPEVVATTKTTTSAVPPPVLPPTQRRIRPNPRPRVEPPRPTERLYCYQCGRAAPANAREGSVCPHCQREQDARMRQIAKAHEPQLTCTRCWRDAPAGAKRGDPCPYCNRPRLNEVYQTGYQVGVVIRYVIIGAVVIAVLGWVARKFT